MGATAIAAIVESAISLGVQLIPFVESLIALKSNLSQPNRPDVDDGTLAALDAAIATIQAKIDAAAPQS